MPDVDFSVILNLPPEKIVKFFESKGYTFSFKWDEVWQSSHNKAFTVAKAMKLDILQSIRNEVEKSIAEGTTFEQFQTNLEPTLKKLGWWGKQFEINPETKLPEFVQLGSPERLRTIYETNLSVSYSIGNYWGMKDNIEDRPFWQYKIVDDPNTRDQHRLLKDKIYPADDPFWDTYFPPNDWGCRCWVEPLTKEQVKALGFVPEKSMPPKNTVPPPEWAYNPALTAWEPDLSQYDSDIKKLWKAK